MLAINESYSYLNIDHFANLTTEKWLHWGDSNFGSALQLHFNNLTEWNIANAIDLFNFMSMSIYYPIFILNVFHLTYSLVLLSSLVILSLVIYIYIFRSSNHKLKKEMEVLKREQYILIEDFETTIAALEQSKEEISQQNLFIKQLTIILAHDLQSPFRFIKMGTEMLHQSILAQQYDEAEVLSIEVKQSSEYTYRFITDFTLWLRSIDKDYKPKLEEVNLYEMINDLNNFFAGLLKCRKNKWQQDIPHDLKVFTDKELLKVIVRNIIDNANKHNFERTIKIASHTTSENCAIIISDNGAGLSDKALQRIDTYINRHKNSGFENTADDNKHGHKLIAHFSKLLNLDINISSKTNTGTTFSVTKLVRI